MSSATILYLLSVLLICSSSALIVLARRSAWIRRVFGAERMVEDVLETDFFDDSGEFTRPRSRASGIVAPPAARLSSGFERLEGPAADFERRITTGRLDPSSIARSTGMHERGPDERFDALAVRGGNGIRAILPVSGLPKAPSPDRFAGPVSDDSNSGRDDGETSASDGGEDSSRATEEQNLCPGSQPEPES
jgi:hypothetical protein